MDVYQKAIDYLLEQPDVQRAISNAWAGANSRKEGCLFRFCTPNGKCSFELHSYGCLSMVKGGEYVAYCPILTEKIIADDRISSFTHNIQPTREALEVFREYQMEMDEMWDRELPHWEEDKNVLR